MKKWSKSQSDDNKSMTKYIGMDLHKNFLQIAVMDNSSKLLENSRIENDPKKMDSFFQNVPNDR